MSVSVAAGPIVIAEGARAPGAAAAGEREGIKMHFFVFVFASLFLLLFLIEKYVRF